MLYEISKKYLEKSTNSPKTVYASKLIEPAQCLVNDLFEEQTSFIDSSGYDNIQFGIFYEKHFIRKLKNCGVEILASDEFGGQMSIKHGIVKGKVDAFINYKGSKIIVECKTCLNLPLKAKEEHIWQLGYYVAYSDCDYGILHYANREFKCVEFALEKNNPIIEKIKNKVELVNEIYKTKTELISKKNTTRIDT